MKRKLPIELQEYLQSPSNDHRWVFTREEEAQQIQKMKEYIYENNPFWRGPLLKVFIDRDYGLFSWLADVRNYSNIPALGCEKGVPSDMSDYVKSQYEEWYEEIKSEQLT